MSFSSDILRFNSLDKYEYVYYKQTANVRDMKN